MGVIAPPLRVLLVADDPGYVRALGATATFTPGGPWIVETARTLEAGLRRLGEGGIDALLVDLILPDSTGMDSVRRLCREHPTLPVVVLTAQDDPALGLAALQAGAQDYVVKNPLHEQVVDRSLRYAAERKRHTLILRRLQAAVDTMQIGVTITDVQGRIVYTNRAEAEMHGYTMEELLGRPARDLSPRENWRSMSPEELRHTRRWKRERIRMKKDGTAFPVQLMSDVVMEASGEPIGIVTTCEDITDRWKADEALRQSEERYALAARGTNDGLWDWNLETGRAYFSRHWTALVGEEEQGVSPRIEEWLDRIHPEDRPRVERKIDDHVQGRSERFEDEHRIRHKNGSWRWVLARAYAARGRHGRAYRMAGAHSDVTDRRAYDPLTALPNRALFLERLEEALARDRRRRSPSFAVLFVDLDHFKAVNDTLGHVAGDEFLKEVSRRLQDCVRPGDTVARFAGDEFAILLERIQDALDATTVADRILLSLERPIRLGHQEATPSASIGVSIGQTEHESPEDVLKDADAAMYRAKDEGRGRWQICDHELRQQVAARSRVSDDLRHAVERGELGIHYQPVVDLATGTLAGFEALLRWRGLLLPLDFVSHTEQAATLAPIEEWMLREACRQAGTWYAAHPGAWRLYVNVSTARFLRPQFLQELDERMAEAIVPPGCLVLEVTEEALLRDARIVDSLLERLAARGVGVQLDRFGAGQSALGALRRAPLFGVKLDASLLGPPAPSPILGAVVSLAASLRLPVMVSGIDAERQAQWVQGLSCGLGQGVFFSEPLSPEDAQVLLATGKVWNHLLVGRGTPEGLRKGDLA